MKRTFYWPAGNWRECLAILTSHLWGHLEHRPINHRRISSSGILHSLSPAQLRDELLCSLLGLLPNAHKLPWRDSKQSSIRKLRLFGLEMVEGNTPVVFSVCCSSLLLLTKFSSELQIHLERPGLYLSQSKPFIRKGHPPLASGGFLAGRMNWPSGTESNSFIHKQVGCCRQNTKST